MLHSHFQQPPQLPPSDFPARHSPLNIPIIRFPHQIPRPLKLLPKLNLRNSDRLASILRQKAHFRPNTRLPKTISTQATLFQRYAPWHASLELICAEYQGAMLETPSSSLAQVSSLADDGSKEATCVRLLALIEQGMGLLAYWWSCEWGVWGDSCAGRGVLAWEYECGCGDLSRACGVLLLVTRSVKPLMIILYH